MKTMLDATFFYESSFHPCFAQPQPIERVWRYMSLSKFVSLLHTRALHFSRSDRLGDPFEGSWARHQPSREYLVAIGHRELEAARRKVMLDASRESVAINCWHLSEYESAAMWSQYGNSGLAVQSTFERLTNSLPLKAADADLTRAIFIGRVQYIDYEQTSIPEDNLFWPFMHKRMSFKHENEVRAVLDIRGTELHDYPHLNMQAISGGVPERGVDVPVDLSRLVERIYVAPAANDWFGDAVRAIVSRFELEAEVVHSDLDAQPIA